MWGLPCTQITDAKWIAWSRMPMLQCTRQSKQVKIAGLYIGRTWIRLRGTGHVSHGRSVIARALEQDEFCAAVSRCPPCRWDGGAFGSVGANARHVWCRPAFVLPSQFIGTAEHTGQIVELDRWVLQEAVRTLKKYPRLPAIAVNLSAPKHRRGWARSRCWESI